MNSSRTILLNPKLVDSKPVTSASSSIITLTFLVVTYSYKEKF